MTIHYAWVNHEIEYDYRLLDFAHKLPNMLDICISSGKSPMVVALDNGTPVSVLYVENTNVMLSFDIIVTPKYRGQGIASELVDFIIDIYNDNIEEYGDKYHVTADSTNPIMSHILKAKGFTLHEATPNNGETYTYGGMSESNYIDDLFNIEPKGYSDQVVDDIITIVLDARQISEKDFIGAQECMDSIRSAMANPDILAHVAKFQTNGKRTKFCAEYIYDKYNDNFEACDD